MLLKHHDEDVTCTKCDDRFTDTFARAIDKKFKQAMPTTWRFGDNLYSRLDECSVEFVAPGRQVRIPHSCETAVFTNWWRHSDECLVRLLSDERKDCRLKIHAISPIETKGAKRPYSALSSAAEVWALYTIRLSSSVQSQKHKRAVGTTSEHDAGSEGKEVGEAARGGQRGRGSSGGGSEVGRE